MRRSIMALVAFTSACSAATAVSVRELPTTVDVRVGHRVSIEATNQVIEFIEVLEDSRCPLGVFCIRAGDFTVALGITDPGASTSHRVSLHWLRPDTANGLVLSIENIQPVRRQQQVIDPKSYVISLHIVKRGE